MLKNKMLKNKDEEIVLNELKKFDKEIVLKRLNEDIYEIIYAYDNCYEDSDFGYFCNKFNLYFNEVDNGEELLKKFIYELRNKIK